MKTLTFSGFEKIVVYANDGAIVLHGNTRNTIQERGQNAINVVAKWCEEHKMKLSQSKTVMMLLRGKLNLGRPPIIYLESKPVKMVSEMCYLGITLETGVVGPKIKKHVIKVTKKCRNVFGSLRRIAKRDWGLNYRALETIYRGLFIPIVSYAAASWHHMANEKDWRTLTLAQRHALIGVTQAYRTVSAEAVQVLARAIPIRMEIEKRVANYKMRKGIAFWMYDYEYIPANSTKEQIGHRKTALKQIYKRSLDRWQERWEETEKGRITRKFFPNINEGMKAKWINANYYTSQFLTGHGDFRAKLMELGICEDSKCTCGEEETNEHILLTCTNWSSQREVLIRELLEIQIP